MTDWTDADYGREDGRSDALAHRIRDNAIGTGDYARAYLEAYDAALAEVAPANVRRVES